MARAEQPVARLGWVLDGEFVWEPHRGPGRRAAEGLGDVLRGLQRVEPVDEAAVLVAVLLGEAVDADPTNAALWGQFRAALADLRSVGAGDSDALDQLLAELSAPISDTAVAEPGDAGGPGRSGGEDVGAALDGSPAVDRGHRRGAAS